MNEQIRVREEKRNAENEVLRKLIVAGNLMAIRLQGRLHEAPVVDKQLADTWERALLKFQGRQS